MKLSSISIVLLLCVGAVGCGPSKSEYVTVDVPVSGTVTLDGQPLAGATVMFNAPSTGASFFGATGEDGVYRLKSAPRGETVCQGAYQVVISKMLKADGTALGPDEQPMIVHATESLPAKYSLGGLDGVLKAEVPEGGGTFDFKLDSK